MKTFPVLFGFLVLFQEGTAQIKDDFSDGDFSDGPSWFGTADFVVNADRQLQLNAVAAGTSWLVMEVPTGDDGGREWSLFIRQSFAPSSANYGRIYLSSDQQDLSGPLNGYYLQFGESGSNDAVELFRQSGTTSTSVCRASPGTIASSFGIRVKVIRQDSGSWEIFIDYSGGSDFVPAATGMDAAHPISGFFGIRCTYTITNATRFYFDDISINTFKLPDTTAPEFESLEITSASSLKIVFSEPLDVSTVNPQDFTVDNTANHASHIELKEDLRTILVFFSQPFGNGRQSTLHVDGVSDASGNSLLPTDVEFLYFQESPVFFKDIVITEIFPDPSPPQGLPEAEFIEVFNRSLNPIDLSGWVLADESSSVILGEFILLPNSYLILTSASSTQYSVFGETLFLSRLPSLNNTGDIVSLKDDAGMTIDSLRYASSWYHDDEKADGGWTLELIDPQNICDIEGNWTASEAIVGGTPGKKNSVFANRPDNTGPILLSVVPVDSATIIISFNEKIDSQLPALSQFTIQPPLGISSIQLDSALRSFKLDLAVNIQPGIEYSITAAEIYDCPGNKIQDGHGTLHFILPEKAEAGDVIVNEILFNPHPTGVDFVEIYNRSEKTIDINNWSLRNYSAANASVLITAGHQLLRPYQYLVFTENPNVLKGEYLAGIEEAFFLTDLPGLNDDEGSIVIINDKQEVIDSAFYNETMHTAFLQDPEGVSLERISFDLSTVESSNWRSASSASGYASPGYINSNSRPDFDLDDNSISIEPEVIQLQVAAQDFVRIRYHFAQGGFIANVRIYDQQGRTIREIAANELLGTEGFFRWDGDRDNGETAGRGYYLVWFEIFDVAGMIKTYRKRVAVF